MLTLTNYINAQHCKPESGEYLKVHEPATGELYAHCPASTEGDVNRAADAARAAFPAWSSTPAQERADIFLRIADLLEARKDEFAAAESKDTGKPITLATNADLARSIANFRFFAGSILQSESEFHHTSETEFNYTLRHPRGVAGLIAPWNLPLYLLTWKIAPAIATGNTCVCKPSEVTPVTAWMLCDLLTEAGVPAGVVNMIHGRGDTAGKAIVEHPDIPTLSFTGSTAVGKWIAERAGKDLKRVSLELGGKNPFVVLEDADLDTAIPTAARAAFLNQGQICLCGSRILVHEKIADVFTKRLAALAQDWKIGDPTDPDTQHGAQISKEHLDKIESYMPLSRQLGGTILVGGSRVDPEKLPERCKGGYYFQPTLIRNLPNDCRVIQEEIFGPIATIQTFSSDDEAAQLANSTPYGLSASVWTKDLTRAHTMAARIMSGVVWVNCWMIRDLRTPFGGMKQSGIGREGGHNAIKFFTEPKNVCVRL